MPEAPPTQVVVTEAYLQCLLTQITSQGGVPPVYPHGHNHGIEVDLNNVPTHSVSGFSRLIVEILHKGPLESRNLFGQEAELIGT